MKELLSKIVAILFLLGASYLGYNLCLKTTPKLSPPSTPPDFSVSYIYSFSWMSPLGMVNIDKEIEDDIKNIKSAGFSGIKINFHFRQDNYLPDKIVKVAAQNGLYPIGQLLGHEEKPRDRAFTAEELVDWENFVRKEVRENKDLVYFWEVWNEPAMTELRFRYGTPAEYFELLERTQKIIKEENPLAMVIVTADYTDTQAEVFTNGFLALGGDKYFDYLSFHPYNALDQQSRYDLEETITQEKGLAEKYNKPLWISEIGFPDSDSSEVRQAELASVLFQTAYGNKIPIVWFHWSDRRAPSVDGKTGWGLVRADNTFKPSYNELKILISQLRGEQ